MSDNVASEEEARPVFERIHAVIAEHFDELRWKKLPMRRVSFVEVPDRPGALDEIVSNPFEDEYPVYDPDVLTKKNVEAWIASTLERAGVVMPRGWRVEAAIDEEHVGELMLWFVRD